MNLRRNWLLALVLVMGAAVLTAAPAQAVIISFDLYANPSDGDGVFNDPTFAGQIFDNEYATQIPGGPAGLGMTVSAVNLQADPNLNHHNLAVIFDTANPTGGDTDLQQPFQQLADPSLGYGSGLGPLGEQSPDRIIVLQERDSGTCNAVSCNPADDERGRPAGIISIVFTDPVNILGTDFFDIELLEDGTTDNNAIRFFDAAVGGTELFDSITNAVLHTPFTGGDRTWDRLSYDVEGVIRMDVHLGGSGGFDNIVISVPEPTTFALFGLALAGLGYSRRRLYFPRNCASRNDNPGATP